MISIAYPRCKITFDTLRAKPRLNVFLESPTASIFCRFHIISKSAVIRCALTHFEKKMCEIMKQKTQEWGGEELTSTFPPLPHSVVNHFGGFHDVITAAKLHLKKCLGSAPLWASFAGALRMRVALLPPSHWHRQSCQQQSPWFRYCCNQY